MTDRRALWHDWKYWSFGRSFSPDKLEMHNHSSHFKRKKISSSALIIGSIISIRTVGASATCLVRLLSDACRLSSVSHRGGICWVKLIWGTGAVRAGWRPKQQWLSDSQAPPSRLCLSPFTVVQDRQDFCHLQRWQTAKCSWNQNSSSQHPVVAAWTC